MKMSDRDKLLILVVILAAVTLLPIFLFIRPKTQQIDSMQAELDSLEARYQELKTLSEKKPFFIEQTNTLKQQREDMQNGFAEDIIQENTIMFLYGIEKDFPMYIFDESFDAYEYTEVEAGLEGMLATTTVTFEGTYEKFLKMIDYVFKQNNKMNLTAVTAEYDSKYGLIKGQFTLKEYAFKTEDSHVDTAKIPALNRGQNYNLFCHKEPLYTLDENGESMIVLVEDENAKKEKDKQKVDNDTEANN